MVFHRCVITALAVLTVGTSAAAGPIKLGESGPPLDMGELRASGALDKDVIRALFFRGVRGRGALNSCKDCVNSTSSLHRRDDENSSYRSLFPFSSRNLYRSPTRPGAASPVSNRRVKPDLVTGVGEVPDPTVGGPISNGPGVAPSPAESPTTAPEPGTLVLIGSGLAGALIVRRRQGLGGRPSE
jgi:PEP-CTERM motif-containing protein